MGPGGHGDDHVIEAAGRCRSRQSSILLGCKQGHEVTPDHALLRQVRRASMHQNILRGLGTREGRISPEGSRHDHKVLWRRRRGRAQAPQEVRKHLRPIIRAAPQRCGDLLFAAAPGITADSCSLIRAQKQDASLLVHPAQRPRDCPARQA